MIEDVSSYHARRSAMQRVLAERATDPAIARSHRELANLHDERARRPAEPFVLKIVTS